MSKEVNTEIYIDASPEAVWDILTSLDLYQDWNPLITSSSGIVEVGETLTNRFKPPGGKARTFQVQVTVVDRAHLFAWNGRLLGMSWLFEGRHRFKLEDVPPGTRLTHSEEFSGLAGPLLLRKSLLAQTEEGFTAMNKALKTRAEAQTTST